ncbi:hypothetical protein NC652_007809 [Populus alba x Populus x berolinensis]|nr:hypothetical protein NC652_007809 [Populus alba x Populus x berolinensis]
MGLLFDRIRAIKPSSFATKGFEPISIMGISDLISHPLALKGKEKELKAHCDVVRSFISWIRRNIKVGQRIPERLFKMGKQRS